MAFNQYIPILCFKKNYSPDFILLGGSKFSFQAKDFTPPYSTLPVKYNLPFFLLDKLKGTKEPTDLHQQAFQENYNENFREIFSFIEENQGVTQRKIMAMGENVKSLEDVEKECSLALSAMPTKSGPDDPTLKDKFQE